MRMRIQGKRAWKMALALAVSTVMLVCLALPALAAVPDRPENQYVLDEAGVLSEETEQEIIKENQTLFQETGAQIVVVTVDFLDGETIDDYAYTLFNSWGIGSVERNNGLLLLMAIGEDNYYATSGYGIDDYFDGAKLQEMLNEYLEPDFAAKEYDAGAKKFFDAALSEMESYYANYTDQYTPGEGEQAPSYDYNTYEPTMSDRIHDFFGGFVTSAMRIVIIIVIVLVISAVIRGMGGGRGGPRSGGGGGGGGFWTGLFLGNMLGNSHRRGGWRPPPPGGFGPRPPRGGPGGFGGFHGGGGGFGGGGFRGGGGGFHGGGGTHGGGAGR